jgi:hypothetical protein
MKLMIAAMMAVLAVAALSNTEAEARVPVGVHQCRVIHPGGVTTGGRLWRPGGRGPGFLCR